MEKVYEALEDWNAHHESYYGEVLPDLTIFSHFYDFKDLFASCKPRHELEHDYLKQRRCVWEGVLHKWRHGNPYSEDPVPRDAAALNLSRDVAKLVVRLSSKLGDARVCALGKSQK